MMGWKPCLGKWDKGVTKGNGRWEENIVQDNGGTGQRHYSRERIKSIRWEKGDKGKCLELD
jgi:hypothetical protein